MPEPLPHRRFPWLRTSLCLLLLALLHTAVAAPPVPSPPRLNARAYLMQDFQSGRILVEKNSHQRVEPASLTKLMTAYIVFKELKSGSLKLDEEVRISEKAWRTGGSKMFIEVNKRVKLEDLLQGMIVQSGNDASVALAEHVAGSEDAFASLMNEYAADLGMKDSHFVNSTGLPHKDHYTTAHDLALLTRALIREFPEYYKWYSQKAFTYNNITQYNRNKLLWRDESVDGVKTGHTQSAGYCLIASAKRNDMRLITVVLGTGSENARAQETQKLLNYGFRFFETHRLYGPGETLTTVRVWKGEVEQLPLGLAEELYVTIPRRQYDRLDAHMTIAPLITAPVARGRTYGSVEVRLGEEVIARRPLVALRDVAEGSLFQRLSDEVLLFFEE
ncbi:MAG TPA: D-alanyl-D-alanine carboxypeptidase [Gammaproteobacteria bacterium]|nr:D-alanyl-D-alanine carboxypeptidase [Gammaproteobacteria bacterium]